MKNNSGFYGEINFLIWNEMHAGIRHMWNVSLGTCDSASINLRDKVCSCV